MDAERVRRELWKGLNEINLSKVLSVFCATRGDLTSFVATVAETIADESKPEPPEPPKTVLPDVSDLKPGTDAWFFAEDGTRVSCFCCFDGECQWSAGGEEGFSPSYFVSRYPHLGRLRRAVPGEVAE